MPASAHRRNPWYRAPHEGFTLIRATAAHHGLVALHDDKDFAATAGLPADPDGHSVHRTPN
ncbi:hypothetical protein ABZS88_20425 [Streptomyces sp. NPDC005480]|uniref:hypothetical protein n=1 Tax=Streptomyces sp. NPDC005480 TaxID=3154880 RepID=UPI0033B9E986